MSDNFNPTTQLSDNDTTCCVFNPNRSTMYCALNIKLRCRVKNEAKVGTETALRALCQHAGIPQENYLL